MDPTLNPTQNPTLVRVGDEIRNEGSTNTGMYFTFLVSGRPLPTTTVPVSHSYRFNLPFGSILFEYKNRLLDYNIIAFRHSSSSKNGLMRRQPTKRGRPHMVT